MTILSRHCSSHLSVYSDSNEFVNVYSRVRAATIYHCLMLQTVAAGVEQLAERLAEADYGSALQDKTNSSVAVAVKRGCTVLGGQSGSRSFE